MITFFFCLTRLRIGSASETRVEIDNWANQHAKVHQLRVLVLANDTGVAAHLDLVGGEVEVRFTIEATGRVTGCRVSRSSGDASLDATTCRLIEERFRFKPATNAAGEAIRSPYGWRQSWWLERRN